MRTRFLNIDYFNPSPSLNLETVGFNCLRPVPQFPSDPNPFCVFDEVLRFDPIPGISLQIEKLPIDSALSKFYSDVIPHKIGTANGEVTDDDFEERRSFGSGNVQTRGLEKVLREATTSLIELNGDSKFLYEELEEKTQRTFGSETSESEDLKKDNGTAVNIWDIRRYEVIQFETPELDEIQILTELPEVKVDMEIFDEGLTSQCASEVVESVYSVEGINSGYLADQKASISEDDSNQCQMQCPQTFSSFEVDEICLETVTCLSTENVLLSFLETMESRNWMQNAELYIDTKELLGSVKHNIEEFLSDNCLTRMCLDLELSPPDLFQGVNLVRLLEAFESQGIFASQGTDDLSMNPVMFEEFQMVDVYASQVFESLFDAQTSARIEMSDCMFSENMNFKNFNELVIGPELILVDDIFKSLPVPIISDEGKILSLFVIIEEVLTNLKVRSLFASDGIYLDWHLFEEDQCNSKMYSSYQRLWEGIYPQCIDIAHESFGKGSSFYDCVFYDDTVTEPITGESGELKEFISDSTSVLTGQTEVAASKWLNVGYSQQENHELVSVENIERAPLQFKSMSQFNDLDFFLNTRKATMGGTHGESVHDGVDTSVSLPKVTCGDSMVANKIMIIEGDSCFVRPPEENMNAQKSEKLSNLLPVTEKYNVETIMAAAEGEACRRPLPVSSAPHAVKSEHSDPHMISFEETVIVVNTKNFEKEMIVSRRSSYQKILALEKEGAQIIERDSDLSVDLVLSSSICLVWYDCRNIGRKSSTMDEASSCLPLCLENVATDVLTSLSFTFSGCFLVFEGETSFLSTVMESSDGFYAAAASLGIDLQLFCSYSPEITDQIILKCLRYATKLTRGVYPKMSESETLAESFLSKFPSVNPLTVHGILSSSGNLIKFFEWSNEGRLHAVERYRVPEESISLFSCLCKYGEQEASKSIMTDCSSSVSSGPDSERCRFSFSSERKRVKHLHTSQNKDNKIDLLHFDPMKPSVEGFLYPSTVSNPNDSCMLRDADIFDPFRKDRSPMDDLLVQKQELEAFDAAIMMDPARVSKQRATWISKGPEISDELKKPRVSLYEKMLGKNKEGDTSMKKILKWNNSGNAENQHQDLTGEVIDLTHKPTLREDLFSFSNSMDFLTSMPDIGNDSSIKSKTARRLPFEKSSYPIAQTAAKINLDSDIWNSDKERRQSSRGSNEGYPDSNIRNFVFPSKYQERLSEEGSIQRSSGNSEGLHLPEKELPYSTPLSNALRSDHLQENSPWTMEFLNKIKERSRKRQQSLPCNPSVPSPDYPSHASKVAKRRSPSILEFFKYQSGSTMRKRPEQKRQKKSIKSSSPTENEISASTMHPTWTPIDKRSRQALSFAMNGSGSQTKLVWSDGNYSTSRSSSESR